jgi:hypothetical protein
MKTLVTAIALSAALSMPVLADNEHNHQHGNDMKEAGMHGTMMDQEHMMKMHEHMQEMEKLMSKIKRENDPKKREKLMNEHMESMHKGMNMMNANMRGKHSKGSMEMTPDQHMEMMENRLDIMQRMMEQMMQENEEERKLHKEMKQK